MTGLEDRPFVALVTKDGRVRISWRSTVVTTVAGSEASRLIAALERADEETAQQLLARATGNFKRGNERPQ
ncbi:MAG: hypothetical protein ACXWZF_02035 [Actinomycetota bacterium]